MTRPEWLEFQAKFFDEIKVLTKQKNEDYAGMGDDPFANFRLIGHVVGDEKAVLVGMVTRLTDKLSRLGTYVKRGEFSVEGEGVKDTLQDICGYSSLIAGLLEENATKEVIVKTFAGLARKHVDLPHLADALGEIPGAKS